MGLLFLTRATKIWIIWSLFILLVNLLVFLFRAHLNQIAVLLVVFFTMPAIIAAYFLCILFCSDDPKNSRP